MKRLFKKLLNAPFNSKNLAIISILYLLLIAGIFIVIIKLKQHHENKISTRRINN